MIVSVFADRTSAKSRTPFGAEFCAVAKREWLADGMAARTSTYDRACLFWYAAGMRAASQRKRMLKGHAVPEHVVGFLRHWKS